MTTRVPFASEMSRKRAAAHPFTRELQTLLEPCNVRPIDIRGALFDIFGIDNAEAVVLFERVLFKRERHRPREATTISRNRKACGVMGNHALHQQDSQTPQQYQNDGQCSMV